METEKWNVEREAVYDDNQIEASQIFQGREGDNLCSKVITQKVGEEAIPMHEKIH